MSHFISRLIQNFFYILVFVAIVFFSSATVLVLNPSFKNSQKNEVAGIEEEQVKLPLSIESRDFLLKKYAEVTNLTVELNDLKETVNKSNFLIVNNPHEKNTSLIINLRISPELKDYVDVYITDVLNKVIFLKDGLVYAQELQIPKKSERVFSLSLEPISKILFPFSLSFDLE